MLLHRTKELISPASIDASRSTDEALAVNLSRSQVEHSPDVDMEKPVSRQYEEIYARYYGIPLYWVPPEAAAAAMPTVERAAEMDAELRAAERTVICLSPALERRGHRLFDRGPRRRHRPCR